MNQTVDIAYLDSANVPLERCAPLTVVNAAKHCVRDLVTAH